MTYTVRDVVIGTLVSIFGVSSWILPYENFAPNVPSWVISTLFFWYLLFPLILPRVQKWSNDQLAYSLVEYYWMQLGLGFIIIVGFGGLAGSYVSSINAFECSYVYFINLTIIQHYG